MLCRCFRQQLGDFCSIYRCNDNKALDSRPRMTGSVAVAVDWRTLLTFVVKWVARSLAV